MDACFLGIDLDTSGLRALLVTKSGEIIGEGEAHYSVSNPADGFSEQDPADWISACQVALGALWQAFPEAYRSVAGIGVAGHMHGATLLDAAGAVLRPCILWNDTRSHAEAAALDAVENLRGDQERDDQVRVGQVRVGQVRPGQVRTGQVCVLTVRIAGGCRSHHATAWSA